MQMTNAVMIVGLLAAVCAQPLPACDAEWHQNGELPDWANISFSESNNPTPRPRRKRQKIAEKKKRDDRNRTSRAMQRQTDEEDDGFIRFRED
jgi:hypothetical protein